MKISAHSLDKLETAIKPKDTIENRAKYLVGNFPRADRVNNLDVRYRWDLLYLSMIAQDIHRITEDEDLNSNTLDTALKRIVPEFYTLTYHDPEEYFFEEPPDPDEIPDNDSDLYAEACIVVEAAAKDGLLLHPDHVAQWLYNRRKDGIE